jgi:hypothetical protein
MNGNHKAPPEISGAFPMASGLEGLDGPEGLEVPLNVAQQRIRQTNFLPDPAARSLRTILYNLYRQEWAGGPLTRWIWGALLLLGGLWAIWLQPRWLGIAVALVAVIALFVTLGILRRSDFVRFEEQPLPTVAPEPLSPNDKIAVYATGHFMVEGQYRRFTYLPGYFRTFVTREHAVLCLARDRRFLKFGQWPVFDVGMWYAFCTGGLIEQVRYGQLHFERQPRPAIAIDYQLTRPATGRLSGEKTLEETIYLVCTSEADTQRLLADLLTDKAAAILADTVEAG